MNALSKVFFLVVAVFILAATFGIFYNSDIRASSIPAGAQYLVKLENYEPYPDQYYTSANPVAESGGFQISNYWTFELMHHPFAIGEWVYHPYALTVTSSAYLVTVITK
jgi:hypothetical protein